MPTNSTNAKNWQKFETTVQRNFASAVGSRGGRHDASQTPTLASMAPAMQNTWPDDVEAGLPPLAGPRFNFWPSYQRYRPSF